MFEDDIRELEDFRDKVHRWLMPQLVHSPRANMGLEVLKGLDVVVGLLRSIDERPS